MSVIVYVCMYVYECVHVYVCVQLYELTHSSYAREGKYQYENKKTDVFLQGKEEIKVHRERHLHATLQRDRRTYTLSQTHRADIRTFSHTHTHKHERTEILG